MEENKENILSEVHLDCNVGDKICPGCAVTKEDWELLNTLNEENKRGINAYGLIQWLNFCIMDGELVHLSEVLTEDDMETEDGEVVKLIKENHQKPILSKPIIN